MKNKPAKSFKELVVWRKAHEFVLLTYKYTGAFPKEELYVLTSQFRHAAISIPANIAEGFKRLGKADKARFYNISQSSLEECRYYLILSNDLQYGSSEKMDALLEEISKMLDSYVSSILDSIS